MIDIFFKNKRCTHSLHKVYMNSYLQSPNFLALCWSTVDKTATINNFLDKSISYRVRGIFYFYKKCPP